MRSQIAVGILVATLAGVSGAVSAVEAPRFKVSVSEDADGKQLHVRRAHQLASKQCAAEGFEVATTESRMPVRECAQQQGSACARWERAVTYTCGAAHGTRNAVTSGVR